MKTFVVAVAAGVLVSCASAQSQPQSQAQSGGTPIHVTVDSEVRDLARGYAAAFSSMSRPPFTLAFQKEGSLRVLEDVKQIRAEEGVLVVEVGKGIFYVVNPKDVVYLTDGAQLPKKATTP